MNNSFMFILMFLFVFVYFLLVYKIISLKKEYTKIKNKNILFEKYFNTIQENKLMDEENVHKENFIKFLSESRDWAYEYIEEVQKGLNSFVESVDSDINYFDTYGDTLSMVRPDYNAMKNISHSYKKLKQFLPEKTQ
jgi:hypothetical protein